MRAHPPLPSLREKTSPLRLLMVYVQIKSAHLITLQCIGGTFNERVSRKSFHCQRNYARISEKTWYIAEAVACLALQEKTCFHFALRRVKTEISKGARADFSYRYRQKTNPSRLRAEQKKSRLEKQPSIYLTHRQDKKKKSACTSADACQIN